MESNEQTELTSKTETDSQIESRLTALRQVKGWSKKEKKLMDTDNSVVIVVGWGVGEHGRGYKRDKW